MSNTTFMKRFQGLLLAGLLCTFNSFGQLSEAQIDLLAERAMAEFDVAGLAIGVVKDGQVVHSKGYGLRQMDKAHKVDEHTNFAIASNSKAFTATALAMLVEDGKINWNDRVIDHIPEFTMYNDYVRENFNIVDLLTHRSGLGLGVGDLMFFPVGADFDINDLLASFQYFKPESAFRTQFDYDNLLYIVAGELIARVSGQSWEEFVMQRIIQPLGMDHTYTALDQVPEGDNFCQPHVNQGDDLVLTQHEQFSMNGAAAGILSNVDDMNKWLLLQLQGGEYKGQELYSKQNQAEMWRIHTVLPARNYDRYRSHFRGYGLGWFLQDVNGYMQVHHTGGLVGMLSKTIMIPDLNLGVVVLTNTSEGGGEAYASLTQSIVDGYLGLEPMDWIKLYGESSSHESGESEAFVKEVWETVEAADAGKIKAKNYVGIYRDNWFGEVRIYKKRGKLWFQSMKSPKLHAQMHFYKDNSFAIKWDDREMKCDAFANFEMDADGKAIGIKMKGIAPDIDFSYDFHDLDLKRVD